ncbi:P1 family peptidase [Virgibacillus pantothenticus]|uniref:DmpA family aminopeptidase n=1 Tax=Virgibacillus TaxID=84406 RepID=UPI00090AD5B0|nr:MULTISPECIES: P1 family peptidase [Virgibacillus]API91358.1 aminopeptidase [Virgibacillus sp. 6R]MBS7426596.1 P1 family peptidase [Virgibacillus sp. 19R1-5]MBU8567219.1 P1 family peptidase [Virgibacillus pantothenticus]MBU8599976.1 P1 family peptidase [Virgibacillus pantothenticus]MBU8635443.1 P1 family peptidase [Virgibacillus pantothenticus]
MKLKKGKNNCITDIRGVQVGHISLYEKLDNKTTICTGVTAILPHHNNLFHHKVHAGSAVLNGFGKTTGLIQVNELGLLESPIMLTNTFSVGAVWQGALDYMLGTTEEIGDTTSSINIVVGECNDSYLNTARYPSVKPEHAIKAIELACPSPVVEGAVGAGKGMVCFGYKGGIGTASRIVKHESTSYQIGCLVLSNFGKREDALFADWGPIKQDTPDGSIMIILATDAPLQERQLQRLSKRCAAGLGRTGSHLDNGSGDIAFAFSTATTVSHTWKQITDTINFLRDDHPLMNQLFQAVVEIVEESIIRSLQMAETTVGRMGRIVEKAPL